MALPEISQSSARVRCRDDAGFALAMVVFLLFAVAIAGLTGYQVVSGEATLASGNEDADVALAVANGGLHRYVGERIGEPGPDTYSIGGGSVTVTPQKVARLNDSTELYLLEAVGAVTDPRYPTSPATRTVRQYAYLNTMPVRAVAALITVENTVDFLDDWQVAGNDIAEPGDCVGVQGARFSIHGIAGTGTAGIGATTPVPGNSRVSPDRYQVGGGTAAEVVAAAEVRWPVIKDPDFNVTYIDEMPNFAAIGADSFPVIRMNGDYTPESSGAGSADRHRVLLARYEHGLGWDHPGRQNQQRHQPRKNLRRKRGAQGRSRGGTRRDPKFRVAGPSGRGIRNLPQPLLRAEGEPFASLSVPDRRLALGLLTGGARRSVTYPTPFDTRGSRPSTRADSDPPLRLAR